MPLANWIQCTGGDLRYTRKNIDPESKETEEDAQAWAAIYDDYLKRFGLGKMYLKLLETMRKKALLELDFIITGQRFKLTEIKIEEERLKTMLNNNRQGVTIEQSLIHLSKWLGYHLSPKKITVSEYFNLLEEYAKTNKKN